MVGLGTTTVLYREGCAGSDHTGGSCESSPTVRPALLFVSYALPSASLHDECGCRQPGRRWMGVHIVRELLGPRYDNSVRRSQLQSTSRGVGVGKKTTPSDINRGAGTSMEERRLVTPLSFPDSAGQPSLTSSVLLPALGDDTCSPGPSKEGPDVKLPTTHSKQKSPWKSRGQSCGRLTGSGPVRNGLQTPAEGLLRYLSAGTTGSLTSMIHLSDGDLPILLLCC